MPATVRPPLYFPTPTFTAEPPILYYTQAGDTLAAVAARFNVLPADITSPRSLPTDRLLDPKILLLIPNRLDEISGDRQIIPDSEVVYSPSALDFDIESFLQGSTEYLKFLKSYSEWHRYGWEDGAQVIRQVALENSINPRLLLVILEEQAQMGFLGNEANPKGLYNQLAWNAEQLITGYYGWRSGRITELVFRDGTTRLRLAPSLNAGTVALLYLFAQLYNRPQWAAILYSSDGIMALFEQMVGNPWLRAQAVEPLFPATLTQPPLAFPFAPGKKWSLTGGPHGAWNKGDARAALDFAPATTVHGCYTSNEWVTAMASGVVVRSENAVVTVDLDGDGYEQTGWSILYLHVAAGDRIAVGSWVNVDDPIGHPSCEGGQATGVNVHVARKYNGEWILADGPLPFNLNGWVAHADADPYQGWLSNGDQKITASLVGEYFSLITRPKD